MRAATRSFSRSPASATPFSTFPRVSRPSAALAPRSTAKPTQDAGSLTTPIASDLTLTAAGSAQGFTLSTFAAGFPNDGVLGPIGIAVRSAGGVQVADDAGNLWQFPTDSDNQSTSAMA